MYKYIKLSLFGAVFMLLFGCKKFIDVNTNPNNATSTNARTVFSGALANTFRNQVSTIGMIIPGTFTGYYAHSNSFTGGGTEKQYAFTNSDYNIFDALYDNLGDYQYVKAHADADGVAFWKEPSNIMQCYVFQMLVDLYGDVPYFETLQGVNSITPKYDDDMLIYDDLVKRLDTAMTNLKAATFPTAGDVVAQDVYFQGNKDKWIRFANTLKLRILMRQSFTTRGAYITTNINNTLANGYLLDNALVQPGYQAVAGKLNPFYVNHGFNEINAIQQNYSYRKMNAVIINFLKNTKDTFRIQSIAAPLGTTSDSVSSNFANYVGIPLGTGAGLTTGLTSSIGPLLIKLGQGTRPGILMTLAEGLLLQAEAAQRYGIVFPAGATPKILYEAGVTAHFRLCANPTVVAGSTAGDPFAQRYLARTAPIAGFTAGVNAFDVNWDLSTDKLRSILVQNWVAYCHINGIAAWSEYRKSYVSPSPSIPYSVRTVATTSNPEPVRFFYPQSESNTNTNNVPTGISAFTSKVFWDVN